MSTIKSFQRLVDKLIRTNSCRRYSIESIKETVGRQVAQHFIRSLDDAANNIDVPTAHVSDPNNLSSWEWVGGLDRVPKFTIAELTKMANSSVDPFKLVEKDVSTLSSGIRDLLGSDHPVLEACAKYFFEIDGGKKIRPTMVLAVAYALNANATANRAPGVILNGLKESLSHPYNRGVSTNNEGEGEYYATTQQTRLAEITEMIHTASLFHDDVIDKAATRRGVPSVNHVFGNKLAILGGDFLLSRASVALARLRNIEVVELLSTVIEHLVKGEIMQMRPAPGDAIDPLVQQYLRKNFYKTASLMGHSCMAAAVLEGYSEGCQRSAYLFGTYSGHAFQLIDDALDFEGTTSTLGKAPLADLKSGLATAPTLFAARQHPQLLQMIARKFEAPGDIEDAVHMVKNSDGLQRCKDLAQVHAELAIEAIDILPPSVAKDSLVALACKIVLRKS